MKESTIRSILKKLIDTPSPVSYYDEMIPCIEEIASKYGLKTYLDEKSTIYLELSGKSHERCVCVTAHLDTLGLMVRGIDAQGRLLLRNLGGLNFSSLEGCYVHVVTRDNKSYEATLACKSHSVHVYDDARSLPRDENSIVAVLDENVHCKQDVLDLGIMNGDIVWVEPTYHECENGYIKSRFIDDKAAVAACFAVIEDMIENNQKPIYDTIFTFPFYEEIGHGGGYLPERVNECVAIDIGLIGEELDGDEHKVSICAKDNYTPYDRELTTRLINLAKNNDINYAVDVFYRYGTDASAAIRAGYNIKGAAFGMGTYSSHGLERTHIDGIMETCKLLHAYLCQK